MVEWWTWSFWADGVLGNLHFGCALLALLLGPVILLRRKGGTWHRWAGRVFVASMLILNTNALFMYDMSGRPNLFHFFAVVSLVTLLSALWGIYRFKQTRSRHHLVLHQHCMVWAYFGLLMAGIWQVAFQLMRFDVITLSPGAFFNALGIFTAIAGGATMTTVKRLYPPPPKTKTA